MDSLMNVRRLAHLTVLGLVALSSFSVAAQTEGDSAPNSRKPVVGIVNPQPGVVSVPFRVQVRAFSPKDPVGLTQTIAADGVKLYYSGANFITLTQNPKYGGASGESGI